MRRVAMLLAVTVTAATAAAVPTAASADPTCSSTDAQFCVDASYAVLAPGTDTPETTAGAPADLRASFDNASADVTSSTQHWLSQVELELLSGLGGNVLTPGADLDDGLLVAGSAAGCDPDAVTYTFTTCTAGYGTLEAEVSNTSLFDGFHPGTFGIDRIVSHHPSTDGVAVDWEVDVSVCVDTTVFGFQCQDTSFELMAPAATATGGDTLTMAAGPSQPLQLSYGVGTATVDYALTSVQALAVDGRSGTLADGTAAPGGDQTVLHLPLRCGTAAGQLVASDRTGHEATVAASLPVTGCPTAAAKATEPAPYVVALDGSASSTPLAPDRTLASWHWSFGDGTSLTSSGPTVRHRYASSRDRTVSLVVVDSAGATSAKVRRLIKGTSLTLSSSKAKAVAGSTLQLSGRLTRWNTTHGLAKRTLRLERCRTDGSHCALIRTVRTDDTGRWAAAATLSGRKPTFRVSFAGGGGYLGTRHALTVGLKTSLPHTG